MVSVEDLKLCWSDEEPLWKIFLSRESELKVVEPWSLFWIRRRWEEEEEEEGWRGKKIECSFDELESL